MTRHPSIQSLPLPGTVVEYLQGNEPHLAWVEEASGDKLRLYTLTRREVKLAGARLLPWLGPRHEGAFNREGILEKLKEHAARRETLRAGLDPLEIWELAQGEVSQNSAAWFAGLAFEQPDVDQVAAMGRALLSVKTHFKFQPPNFEVYPAETVERRLAEQEAARERELVVTAGHVFFQELWAGWSSGRRKDPARLEAQLDPSAAQRLKDLLRAIMADAESQEHGPLWQQLRKGLPEHPAQALILAQEWGIVGPNHNVLLDQAGYDEGDAWSEAFAGEIEALGRDFQARREPPLDTPFLSIDSPTTRDIDDAFHVERLPDGWRVRMALARPTLSWDFESPLGRAVARRASSLYLPEGDSHMLPEALGCGLYSLKAGEDRPALLLDWELDPQGGARSFTPSLGWVRVAANLTYEDVEAALARGDAPPEAAAARDLAALLRGARVERGAVVIDRPEPRIELSGHPGPAHVEIGPGKDYPEAQLAVSELMILANASMAAWAGERGVALFHRVQDVTLPAGYAGVWTDPVDMHRVVKQLCGASLEARPGRHASLAAEAYAPVTSPLRRMADFVNLAQVESFLSAGAPRLTREALQESLGPLAARLDAVAMVQRGRPRYWKLAHLQQVGREREFEAVALEECGHLTALSLTTLQMYTRVPRDMLGGPFQAGQRFRARVGKVDPLTGEFRVLSLREADEKPEAGEWPPKVD
ncbi:Ribonuclease R [Fundidesulfovibrio magnetotacticus]|uniref:Ribonuclease R n=1 Tax=Fundidesulfovibrio magnetotacticus TaxID=2730080 RepID=A0A6V8LYC2_9BACT|nr:ribonuclease catalytic domain-containing protein [Fundidesulfovibrio magnetotacticus]GFK94806.1 Ribonuclease R [Fundidesulfovibrio magnetotacticus]